MAAPSTSPAPAIPPAPAMGLWDTVFKTWDWVCNYVVLPYYCICTVVLPCIATCSAWMNPLVETPIAQPGIDCTIVCTCTTAVCTNCTTVCNRVYNNGFCRPVDLLHIVRNKSTEIIFLSTHFNVTTYEAIPTHVPWNASDFAAAAVVIVVLIGLIVIIYNVNKHWTKIDLYCRTCFASVDMLTVVVFVMSVIILHLMRLGSTGAN